MIAGITETSLCWHLNSSNYLTTITLEGSYLASITVAILAVSPHAEAGIGPTRKVYWFCIITGLAPSPRIHLQSFPPFSFLSEVASRR